VDGNRSLHDTDARPSTLPTLVAVLLVSTIVSAIVTSVVLIAADRLDRPGLAVIDAEIPTITVHIAGAVATPGTYRVPGGARLDDLVTRAGGLSDEADTASVNLAARVGDGEQVRIPAQSTVVPPPPSVASSPAASTVVNINTASAEELDALPGIGPVLSARIVAYREQNGAFTTLDQLAEVDGISTGLLERLGPLITLDD
jgi:competence protein ComEA